MAHPYRDQARSSHKTKAGNMGKMNNVDIPVMRAVGENKSTSPHVSHSSMQHMKQSGADGMKRGGHVGKPKHHKPKIAIAAPAPDPATPPMPDPAMAAAGAGSSPAPAPMGPPPMQKRGGAVHSDEKEDRAMIKKMVKPSARFARGGKVTGMKGGADTGEGRLNKIKMYGLKPIKG